MPFDAVVCVATGTVPAPANKLTVMPPVGTPFTVTRPLMVSRNSSRSTFTSVPRVTVTVTSVASPRALGMQPVGANGQAVKAVAAIRRADRAGHLRVARFTKQQHRHVGQRQTIQPRNAANLRQAQRQVGTRLQVGHGKRRV